MLGCVGALGFVLVWIGFTSSEANLPVRLVFLAFGVGTIASLPRLSRATAIDLVLTDSGLSDSQGRIIASMDQISRVERGAFAFKPSNGFTLTLKTSAPRGWEPGIWWRIGKRVGVGGVISGNQSKLMADIIAAKLAGTTLF